MMPKKVALIGVEAADLWGRLNVNPHASKRIRISDRRNQSFARIVERNKTPIKEMIDGGGEKETVASSESFLI